MKSLMSPMNLYKAYSEEKLRKLKYIAKDITVNSYSNNNSRKIFLFKFIYKQT